MSKGSRHRSYNEKFRNATYWQKREEEKAKQRPKKQRKPKPVTDTPQCN